MQSQDLFLATDISRNMTGVWVKPKSCFTRMKKYASLVGLRVVLSDSCVLLVDGDADVAVVSA